MSKNASKKRTEKQNGDGELCTRLRQLFQVASGKSAAASYSFTPFPVSILNDRVVLIRKFLEVKLCGDLIQLFSNLNVLKSFKQEGTRDYAARYNDRSSFTSNDIASLLWDRLHTSLKQETAIYENLHFSDAKGLNPQLRIYRYQKGHYFGKHYDDSVTVDGIGTTRWTLLIYLSGDEDLVGGDTIFYQPQEKQQESVHPSKGLALLHEHGDNCLLHEAGIVQRGVKWVLRSDVVF